MAGQHQEVGGTRRGKWNEGGSTGGCTYREMWERHTEKQQIMHGLLPGFWLLCEKNWGLLQEVMAVKSSFQKIPLHTIMLPAWAFSFFTVLASKTPEVFGCTHPRVLAESSRDFKTVWGSQEESCFPNNSWGHQYTGAISKVLSGDNNLLVLDSACSSRRKKIWTEGLFCRSFKPNKRNFDESTVWGRWLMFWGIRRLLIPEVCSWHRSQHVYDLKKQTRDAKNTPRFSLTAGCQNVIFRFWYFLLIFGHFHKYYVYFFFPVFLYKSRPCGLRLKGLLQERMSVVARHLSVLLDKSFSPSCLLMRWFWVWAPLT